MDPPPPPPPMADRLSHGVPIVPLLNALEKVSKSQNEVKPTDSSSSGVQARTTPWPPSQTSSETSHVNSEHFRSINFPSSSSAPYSSSQNRHRLFMETRVKELCKNLQHLPPQLGSRHDADVLIYLENHHSLKIKVNDGFWSHCSVPLQVRSERINALNSPYLQKLMGPFYQTRIRKKYPKTQSSDNKKYVLNLAPELEGDKAIEYMTAMSCPLGVRKWHESTHRWEVARTLVGGEDEFSSSTINSDEAEYKYERHVVSIERFFVALEGQDPRFDSAPKVFSTVMVSKLLQVQDNNPLVSWVAAWLRADPNSKFIECFPEVTLAMADVLRSAPLCKDAFGILVGESVLDSAVRMSNPRLLKNGETVFGRHCDDIEEMWQTRIEYARNAFTDRVQRTFDDLAGIESHMDWVHDLPSCKIMRDQGRRIKDFTPLYENFIDILQRFIRGAVFKVLSSDYEIVDDPFLRNKPGGDTLYPRNSVGKTWTKLRPTQRIFTRTFWDMLKSCQFRSRRGTNLETVETKFAVLDYEDNSEDVNNIALFKVFNGTLDVAARACVDVLNRLPVSQRPNFTNEAVRSIPHHPAAPFTENGFLPSSQQFAYQSTNLRLLASQSEAEKRVLCSVWKCTQRISLDQTCAWCDSCFCNTHIWCTGHDCKLVKNENAGNSEPAAYSQDDGGSQEFLINHTAGEAETTSHQEFTTASNDTPNHPSVEQGSLQRNGDTGSNSHVPPCTAQSVFATITQPTIPGRNGEQLEGSRHWENVVTRTAPQQDMAISWEDYSPEHRASNDLIQAQASDPDMYQNMRNDLHSGQPSNIASTQSYYRFTRGQFLGEVSCHFAKVADAMLGTVPGGELGSPDDARLTNTLLCMSSEELKYLPLWADGNDDGTGGVFGSNIPQALDAMPPGDEIRHGMMDGEYDMMTDTHSTVNSSTFVNDGYNSRPRHAVIAMDDSSSLSSLGAHSFATPGSTVDGDSDDASTLGDMEPAIDLGTTDFAPPQSTVQNQTIATPSANESFDDVFMENNSGDEADFDDDGDDDVDMNEYTDDDDVLEDAEFINAEELDEPQTSATASSAASGGPATDKGKGKARETTPAYLTNPTLAAELSEACENATIVYKEGLEDELMTRP